MWTRNTVFFVEISFTGRCKFHWERSTSNFPFSKIWDLTGDIPCKTYIYYLPTCIISTQTVCQVFSNWDHYISRRMVPLTSFHLSHEASQKAISSVSLPWITRSTNEPVLSSRGSFSTESWRHPLDLKTRKLLSAWIFPRGLTFGCSTSWKVNEECFFFWSCRGLAVDWLFRGDGGQWRRWTRSRRFIQRISFGLGLGPGFWAPRHTSK